uniref:AlNc14C213G8958 protein n=1 Tax=Albugo laibachii Nc14 TaxID=890382 RepID=F0WRF5_9STRA|nr:AlNc14C213G8958 [Albugo laibachii Nc14]|eukprot:CCA23918.1 AlNc14C213G8958 [Albugo laibachii Nc14]
MNVFRLKAFVLAVLNAFSASGHSVERHFVELIESDARRERGLQVKVTPWIFTDDNHLIEPTDTNQIYTLALVVGKHNDSSEAHERSSNAFIQKDLTNSKNAHRHSIHEGTFPKSDAYEIEWKHNWTSLKSLIKSKKLFYISSNTVGMDPLYYVGKKIPRSVFISSG